MKLKTFTKKPYGLGFGLLSEFKEDFKYSTLLEHNIFSYGKELNCVQKILHLKKKHITIHAMVLIWKS